MYYSTDEAGHQQSLKNETVFINSLPYVDDIYAALENGDTGQTGDFITFYCDVGDDNGNIDPDYTVEITVDGDGPYSANYAGGDLFKYRYGAITQTFPHNFTVTCNVTDDYGESVSVLGEVETLEFQVQNSPPIVDDIWAVPGSTYPGGNVRFKCTGSDVDGLPESALTASFYLKTDPSEYPPWDRLENVTMSWDGNDHYYDWTVPLNEPVGTMYDARCILTDQAGATGLRDEFDTEFNVSEDADADGVINGEDSMLGNESDVELLASNTPITVFDITANGDTNITDPLEVAGSVQYIANGVTLVNVYHTFSDGPATWYDVTNDKLGISGSGYLTVIAGIENETARIYTPKFGDACNMQYCDGMETVSLSCGSGWVNVTGTISGSLCY